MDREQIKKNAEIVYNVLSKGEPSNYEELKKNTGLRDRELNAAIGWLAQEDKIQFGDSTSVDNISAVHLNMYFG